MKLLLIGIYIDDMLSQFPKYAHFRFDDEEFKIQSVETHCLVLSKLRTCIQKFVG